MTAFTDDERRVVPRWREFHRTLQTSRELGRPVRKGPVPDPGGHFERLLAIWKSGKTLIAAYDLVCAAIVTGRVDEIPEAVGFLRQTPDLSEELRSSVLSDSYLVDYSTFALSGLKEHGKIAYMKSVVRTYPRNAVCWTDLALLYCRVGVVHKASRCMDIALALAPNNRYVLRSACRYFVHIDDMQRAIWVLRRARRTKHDPWLMASEIACSHIVGESSPLLKRGARMLDANDLPPWFVTELAASVGTFELKNGSRRQARRQFKVGAKNPNDNVKAQLQWLRIADVDMVPSEEVDLEGDFDHEARALSCRVDGDWRGAIASCERWGDDEVYSERPFCLGSYVAIEALGDAPSAEALLRKGLVANRRDTILLNNLAVALAMQGKVDEARSRLSDARRTASGLGTVDAVTLKATEGLVEYRDKNIAHGRACYFDAIEMALKNRLDEAVRRAFLYLTLEELEAGTADGKWFSRLVVDRARRTSDGTWPERNALLDRVRRAGRWRQPGSGFSDRIGANRLVDLVY